MVKSNKYGNNKRENLQEGATKSALKPGNYPIGSAQSRATARALLEQKKSKETSIQVVYVSPDGTKTNGHLLRFPAIDLNPGEAATLRERLRNAQERMKDYKPQNVEDGNRIDNERK
jgi:hypothetical protein